MIRQLAIAVILACSCFADQPRPNIVIILADDLGVGDVHALNRDSGIPTPNMDRLAAEGITFTDAHSGSSVCTPTRYGIVTGRYCWRTRLKRGVLNGYGKHLINPDRFTIADLVKQQGYHTACIGKWHLGMDLPMLGKRSVDYAENIANGPNENGFDYFYGITASLDFPPYAYIENDRFTEAATEAQSAVLFPAYLRKGPRAPGFKHEEALDHLTEKAVDYIAEQAKNETPFLLYFPLTSPHKPVLPAERFRGKSALGPYGDFVMQTDWTVGQVLKALDAAGVAENSVVFFTSDNGSFMYQHADKPCHTSGDRHQGYDPSVHQSNHIYRGTKTDVWEGGHRVPFLMRWPGKVAQGSMSTSTICLTDLMATCAEISGAIIPADAAQDSFSFLPEALGNSAASRGEPVVHHSSHGVFALRDGKWKLILGNGSGGRGKPSGKTGQRPYQLYDIETDPSEKDNLIDRFPEVASRLERKMEQLKN